MMCGKLYLNGLRNRSIFRLTKTLVDAEHQFSRSSGLAQHAQTGHLKNEIHSNMFIAIR